jgi:hypothetical protein
MLVGEHRMIDDLRMIILQIHANHLVNKMIKPQMEGGGRGSVGGWFLDSFT